jgi:hypothetical protein
LVVLLVVLLLFATYKQSALRCCAADIKVKADKLNERFSDAQNASRRVKHGLLLLPKALARLQNAKARFVVFYSLFLAVLFNCNLL